MSDDLNPGWAPDACTLPTVDRPLRRAEFDDLFTSTVDLERITDRHARITLAGPSDLADRVRDLAARESECCTFFAFTVTERPPDRVVFDVEVPAAYRNVLDGLVGHATRVWAT